jgi:hypothetical protein
VRAGKNKSRGANLQALRELQKKARGKRKYQTHDRRRGKGQNLSLAL